MKLVISSHSISRLKTDLVILPIAVHTESDGRKRKGSPSSTRFSGSAHLDALNKSSNGQLQQKLDDLGFSHKPGARIDVPLALAGQTSGVVTARISVISAEALGGEAIDEWRKLGGDLAQAARRLGAQKATLLLDVGVKKPEVLLEAVLEGIFLSSYRFEHYKKSPAKKLLSQLEIVTSEKFSTAGIEERAKITAAAVCLARDLVNIGPSDLPPKEIVSRAKRVAAARRLKIRVMGERELAKRKAGGILGVGKGSDMEPFLIHLSYSPRGRAKKRVVLVGKGVTFDSGGLSIKPGKSMEDMKCDMAGAAAVLAAIEAASIRKLPIEIHALIPTVENMVSGRSLRPGDVLRMMSGKTVEVLNTDAEGRLILADALSYAGELKPDLIIDAATLTGACVVALGNDIAGLFANNAELASMIQEEGKKAGEAFWPLPLASEYRSLFDSPIADMRNISASGGPGAIIAALFLKEFVPADVQWAHLDVAGPAFGTKANEYLTQGGSGFAVRTLLRVLERIAQ